MGYSRGKGCHVLVINENLGTRELYRDILQDESYRVTLRNEPIWDPAAVSAMSPDVILLDLLFAHEQSGPAYLEYLKTDPATMAIPVLLCTTDTRHLDSLHDQLLAWDCGVLQKPFALDELLAAIVKCLPRHSVKAAASNDASTCSTGNILP